MNTTRKGNYNQNKARKKLEQDGWQVEVARRSKYKPVDFFGLFDIIAYKEKPAQDMLLDKIGHFKLIQVKSNYCPPEVKRKIKEFVVDGIVVTKEIWIYKDYSRSNPWIEVC